MKRLIIFIICVSIATLCMAQGGLQSMRPEECGMDGARLEQVDRVIGDAIEESAIPGAVVSVVRGDKIVFLKAYGNRALVPEVEPMTVETVFDLASVSKCVSTTLSFMQLIESGLVRLTDKVDMYIPGFKPWIDPESGEAVDIIVRDLLTHSSGLDAYPDVESYVAEFGENTPDEFETYIATRVGRNFRPGTQCLYSCLNFVTLQRILERVTGQRLSDYAQSHIFDPLGLQHTGYLPVEAQVDAQGKARVDSQGKTRTKAQGGKGSRRDPAASRGGDSPRRPFARIGSRSDREAGGTNDSEAMIEEMTSMCAPTEVQEDGKPLRGVVHDPLARRIMGGDSGNAGLFSNAEDLSVICAAIMNGGALPGASPEARILGPLTVELMCEVPAQNDPGVGRALGWDKDGWNPGTRGDIFDPETSIWHTGYTGTSIVIDMKTKTALIILTNRVHPEDKGSLARLRALTANIVAGAVITSFR